MRSGSASAKARQSSRTGQPPHTLRARARLGACGSTNSSAGRPRQAALRIHPGLEYSARQSGAPGSISHAMRTVSTTASESTRSGCDGRTNFWRPSSDTPGSRSSTRCGSSPFRAGCSPDLLDVAIRTGMASVAISALGVREPPPPPKPRPPPRLGDHPQTGHDTALSRAPREGVGFGPNLPVSCRPFPPRTLGLVRAHNVGAGQGTILTA